MKDLTKKELHKQLTDQYVNNHINAFLAKHPGKKTDAALYVAGRLQALLLESMNELPHHTYTELIQKLKG